MAATPEITLKAWVLDEAQRLGKSTGAVHRRIFRGKYPWLYLRRVNKRVVYVDQERAFDWMGEGAFVER